MSNQKGPVVLRVLDEAKKVVIDSKSLLDLVQTSEQQGDDMEERLLNFARSLATTTHQVTKTIFISLLFRPFSILLLFLFKFNLIFMILKCISNDLLQFFSVLSCCQ
jgi:hypothetical protein